MEKGLIPRDNKKRNMTYSQALVKHYKKNWGNRFESCRWESGPMTEVKNTFRVLEFSPVRKRRMWTYATVGMSELYFDNPIEVHIFSIVRSEELVEILTAIAHYHLTFPSKLNLGHSVNFGKPWIDGSLCEFGLISYPYLDSPLLENFYCENQIIKCCWLVPITIREVEFKKQFGIEALETHFENNNLDYADPKRPSLV